MDRPKLLSSKSAEELVIALNHGIFFSSIDEVVEQYKDARMGVALSASFADRKGGLATIDVDIYRRTGLTSRIMSAFAPSASRPWVLSKSS